MSLRRNCRFTGRFGVYDGVYYSDRDLQKKIWNVKNARQDRIVFVSQSGPACRSIGPLTRLSQTTRRVRANQRNHHTNTTNSLFQRQAHLTRPRRRSETVLNISLIRLCNSGILTNFRIKDVNSQGSFSWRRQPYGWLHDSRVHALARDRRRSREFIVLAGNGSPQHPAGWKIRLVMDDHSAHVSKETFKCLVVRVVSNLYSHLNTHRGSTWWRSFSARLPPFISAQYTRAFHRRTD